MGTFWRKTAAVAAAVPNLMISYGCGIRIRKMTVEQSRRARVSVVLVCLPILSACAIIEGYPANPDNNTATLTALQDTYFGPKSEDKYNGIQQTDPNYATLRRNARDEVILGRIHAYDIEFSSFQRALTGYDSMISIGTDLTALALNGLGATNGNKAMKTAFAAASGGVIGAQGVIDKDMFYQKTVPALIAQMEANRAKTKLAIFTGLRQADADYPLGRADSDLADLNDAGSIPNAISNVIQQSTDQKNATQNEIKTLQVLTFSSSDSSIKIRAWLYQNGKVNTAHFAALQAWLNAQPEVLLKGTNYPPGAFVNDANNQLEPIRQRALSDPVLNISS
jgi:hypothetical protein